MLASGTLCACDILESFRSPNPPQLPHEALTALPPGTVRNGLAHGCTTLLKPTVSTIIGIHADLIVPNPASARVPSVPVVEERPRRRIDEYSKAKFYWNGFLEHYLSCGLLLCMVVGVLIGVFLPAVPAFLSRFEYASVSYRLRC